MNVFFKDINWSQIKEFLTFHLLEFINSEGEITFHLDTWMILVSVFSFFVIRYLMKIIEKAVVGKKANMDKVKIHALFKFVNLFVYFVVLLLVLQSTGMKITALLAASTALFIGVGLALQDLLKDIIAGVAILIDKSLMINDIIEIDGKVARVYEINVRTTRAITRNDKILIIPNHSFLNHTIYNYTQNDTSTREEVKIGIAYGSNIELAKQILIDCAKAQEEVLKSPAPSVFFMDFGDSALQFSLFFYIKDAFVSPRIQSDLRFRINQKFQENKIHIPFPQMEVNIQNQ